MARRQSALNGRHVIIAGYGPVGRAVEERLIAQGLDVMVIDLNRETVVRLAEQGKAIVHGDVTDRVTLEQAGVARAQALILTVPDEEQALAACRVARELSPSIFIAARTNFLSKGLLATRAGADHVTVEEVVTADAMSQAVRRRLAELDG